jgi:lethal(2) giant larvae protein
VLAKEMRLKHRAPVVHIQVIDQHMQPLPNEAATSPSTPANASSGGPEHPPPPNHKVIICSEEQFKVFQLPALKPVCKFKLTAVEGARVRRIGYAAYVSKSDAAYSEPCLSCLTNLGDISVYSLPQLKRQALIQCMKQQDINGITSFVFAKLGQAFYLQSPSEFVHISMSARDTPQQQQLALKEAASKTTTTDKVTSTSSSTTTTKTSQNGAHSTTSTGSAKKSSSKPTSNGNSESTAPQQRSTSSSNNAASQAASEGPVADSVTTAAPPVPAPRSLAQTNADNQR